MSHMIDHRKRCEMRDRQAHDISELVACLIVAGIVLYGAVWVLSGGPA